MNIQTLTLGPLATNCYLVRADESSRAVIIDPAANSKRLLAALEERDRKLIFLRYYRGKTQTEVARCLGMTQVQVSRREKRILQSMREQMVG